MLGGASALFGWFLCGVCWWFFDLEGMFIMLRVNPFRAVRPAAGQAECVASVPYDVVNRSEARELAAGNADSFLRVVRSEIDFDDDVSPYDERVYAQAAANLAGLLERAVMVQEDEACLYLYRQVMDGKAQVGLVGCCHVDDYENDLIKKHEKTRKVKEDDRTTHVLSINGNSGPVFLTYRQDAVIDALIAGEISSGDALFDFVAEDGVQHTVWRVRKTDALVEAFGGLNCAYVADGHHRSASAWRAGKERRAANGGGGGEYDWFLSVLFPDEQLSILAYNRVVRDLNELTVGQAITQLKSVGDLSEITCEGAVPERAGVFCFYFGDEKWYRLELREDLIDRNDPIASLDVALLQERILGPMFAIGDPRTDDRIDFVGGIRGIAGLEKRVDEDGCGCAISMYPTSIGQLLAVADAGLVMPPKSTWFEPKLRSGLFVHLLD